MEIDDSGIKVITMLFEQYERSVSKSLSEGFGGINARLDQLNGRVRTGEVNIGVLNDRTSNMACVQHAEWFRNIESKVDALEAITVEHKPRTFVQPDSSLGQAWRKVATIAVAGLTGLLVLGEAIWKWFSAK